MSDTTQIEISPGFTVDTSAPMVEMQTAPAVEKSSLLMDLEAMIVQVSAELDALRASFGHAAAYEASIMQQILNHLVDAAHARRTTDAVLSAIKE